MSIRFAASRTTRSVRMEPLAVRQLAPACANDNGEPIRRDHVNAALRHFAKHGINAAQHAREQAINAGKSGDRQMFEWWLEVCRALDRRMAYKISPTDASVGR